LAKVGLRHIQANLVTRCKTSGTMKHNEQQNYVGFLFIHYNETNTLSTISSHHKCQKPLLSPTFATFIKYSFHQCSKGNGAKNENQNSATLTQRRLQKSRTTTFL
jgi:hypothetical protein